MSLSFDDAIPADMFMSCIEQPVIASTSDSPRLPDPPVRATRQPSAGPSVLDWVRVVPPRLADTGDAETIVSLAAVAGHVWAVTRLVLLMLQATIDQLIVCLYKSDSMHK